MFLQLKPPYHLQQDHQDHLPQAWLKHPTPNVQHSLPGNHALGKAHPGVRHGCLGNIIFRNDIVRL